MKTPCPACQREIDTTKHGKYAPHNSGNARCRMSGKRIETAAPRPSVARPKQGEEQ